MHVINMNSAQQSILYFLRFLLKFFAFIMAIEVALHLAVFVDTVPERVLNAAAMRIAGAYKILYVHDSIYNRVPTLIKEEIERMGLKSRVVVYDEWVKSTLNASEEMESLLDAYHPDAVVLTLGLRRKDGTSDNLDNSWARNNFIGSLWTYQSGRDIWRQLKLGYKELVLNINRAGWLMIKKELLHFPEQYANKAWHRKVKDVYLIDDCIGGMYSPYYSPAAITSFQDMERMLSKRQIKMILVQYPLCSIRSLRKLFEGRPAVIFVENSIEFKAGLEKMNSSYYFSDMTAGAFGHLTADGVRLVAKNIARVLIDKIFNDPGQGHAL